MNVLKKEETLVKEIFSRDVFKGRVLFGEPMKRHTSLRIGGPADVLAFPENIVSLRHVLRLARDADTPITPIGKGTNVLVKDKGIRGIVVSLCMFNELRVEDERFTIIADSGLLLQEIVALSRKTGLKGIEGLSGIPGTLGGAIAGNSGAFGYEIKDVIIDISMMDALGNISLYDVRDVVFGYRSVKLPHGFFITRATLRLLPDDPMDVSKRIDGFLKERKSIQPIGKRSAGCVFKNPRGVSAGKLIDSAGCKGMRAGDIEVSEKHANFFINKGNGNAEDFLRLMEMVSSKVKKKFGVILKPEIKIIGGETAD
ncbi:MAG: UDP-N-acetylmuramate dehydrogenase [Nitrospirae bacterium]|nr:UDP-N-acetylmuramate dehydrogenase [Nitrospirota bacterium]